MIQPSQILYMHLFLIRRYQLGKRELRAKDLSPCVEL
uniref:Uncharacterized protein n=1 Tax=Anguilla anguilla TaxID=7936 RepID=A0A0E9UHP0_ANGAN